DVNGNRTMSGYHTGPDNQMSTDGTWNYSYDAEGNVVTKTKIIGGETWTYSYDTLNHLTNATDKTSGGTVIVSVTEKYDVLGRRVEEDTTSGTTTTVQRFALDAAGNVWADLDGSNNIVMRRMYDDDGAVL